LLASIFIIIVSSVLFVYWFRHTCHLILAQRDTSEYAIRVASTIRLNFPQVQAALHVTEQTPALDRFHQGLENDYRILTDLLRQATDSDSIEHRLLAAHYKVMQGWYKIARTRSDLGQARRALAEMSTVLGFFAGELGEGAAA
jgi:hypothetical protein